MKAKRNEKMGKIPTRKDVPHIRPSKTAVKRLEEEDRALRVTKDIKKEDARFMQEARGLLRFLKRFKKL